MGKKKGIDWDEINLYTNLTFCTEDSTVIFKNIQLDMLELFKDRIEILDKIVYKQWYFFGLYEDVEINGYVFKIVAKSKNKVELVYLTSGSE